MRDSMGRIMAIDASAMVGKRFGRLLIAGVAPKDPRMRATMVYARCDCGTERAFVANRIVSGKCASCGCFRKDVTRMRARKHGLNRTRAHRCWEAMRRRCYNPKDPAYPRYGGRGIRVLWPSFEAFIADMGQPPAGKTIDRYPDNDGHYAPGNCRWATPKEQANNRRPAPLYQRVRCGKCGRDSAIRGGRIYRHKTSKGSWCPC